jgi:hypothetical protein
MLNTQLPTPTNSVGVTVPAAGASIKSLIQQADRGFEGLTPKWVRICAKTIDCATDRAAFRVSSYNAKSGATPAGTDATTHGEPVAAGVEWNRPSDCVGDLIIVPLSGTMACVIVFDVPDLKG